MRAKARLGLAIGVILLASALGARLLAQRWEDRQSRVRLSNGVYDSRFVDIDGHWQWVTMRGRAKDRPLLIVIHGGPGQTLSPFASQFRALEDDFIVVQWDQAGAGKTYVRDGFNLPTDFSVESISTDGVHLAEGLRRQFPRQPIVLLGISSGSAIALQMLSRRPELFSVYVGVGQVVSVPQQEAVGYARILRKSVDARDVKAATKLRTIAPPPYRSIQELSAERAIVDSFERPRLPDLRLARELLTSPDYGMIDVIGRQMGVTASNRRLLGDDMNGPWTSVDVTGWTHSYAVPLLLIQGDQDDITPTALAANWLAAIQAPKRMLCVVGGGHNVIITRQEAVADILRRQVSRLLDTSQDISNDAACHLFNSAPGR